MFHAISWQSYWVAVAVSTGCYYVFIYCRFYKPRGIAFFNQREKGLYPANSGKIWASSIDNNEIGTRSPDETEEQIVQGCMDELEGFFQRQKQSRVIKADLIYGLQELLQKYPSLNSSDYKGSLSNVIAVQCENSCSVHLGVDDMKKIWLGR